MDTTITIERESSTTLSLGEKTYIKVGDGGNFCIISNGEKAYGFNSFSDLVDAIDPEKAVCSSCGKK